VRRPGYEAIQYLLELLLWENYKQSRAEASRHHCGSSTKHHATIVGPLQSITPPLWVLYKAGWVCEAKLEKVVKKKSLALRKLRVQPLILASKSLFDQLLYAKYCTVAT